MGVTYVALEVGASSGVVVGYYTLASSSIAKSLLPDELRRRLPSYSQLPVILLARLAVDQRFQRRGVGPQLLAHALKQALRIRAVVGCRGLIVDAYASALSWYQKYGFVALGDSPPGAATQPMYLDLRTVEAAVQC